jgi:hypothetical protein
MGEAKMGVIVSDDAKSPSIDSRGSKAPKLVGSAQRGVQD